ncbi:MAG: hypothetical protein RIS07_472, partial [Actinomycetota bacterium]
RTIDVGTLRTGLQEVSSEASLCRLRIVPTCGT